MSVADRIKEARKAKHLTQADLGKQIGIAASTIDCYETGKRSPCISQIKLLAETLEVSSDWLMETAVTISENEHDELIYIYDSMNKTGQDAFMAMARGLAVHKEFRRNSAHIKETE